MGNIVISVFVAKKRKNLCRLIQNHRIYLHLQLAIKSIVYKCAKTQLECLMDRANLIRKRPYKAIIISYFYENSFNYDMLAHMVFFDGFCEC
jgi:hypothetical protein